MLVIKHRNCAFIRETIIIRQARLINISENRELQNKALLLNPKVIDSLSALIDPIYNDI